MPVIYLKGLRQRAYALEALRQAPDNATVSIKAPRRTPPQSDKMWAMLHDVARCKPDGHEHTPDMWKAIFMKACDHEVRFAMGLDGEPFPMGFRSSNLSVAQMSELIEFIYSWASPRGVVWREAERSGFME